MRNLYILAGVLLLGGCATPIEVASVTEIRPTNGSRSIDVHEPRRASGQSGVPEFAGDQLVEVRTFADSDNGGRGEIAGAACTLSAADFSATMQTPAKVRVPLYRGQSSSLAISCEKQGFRRKMVTVDAIDVTRNQRMATGASGGLIGVVAALAVDGMSDNTKNIWQYPVARVLLEKEGSPPAAVGSVQ
jgi:hypothetical protein